MTREEIYDAQIHPLMQQIMDLAKAAGIPMHADFELDDEGLRCTTHIPTGASKEWLRLYERNCPGASSPTLVMTTRGAGGEVTSVAHILGDSDV